jgi:hypothetical protein
MLSVVFCDIGELKLLKFLLLNKCRYYEQELAEAAARSGSVELLTYLLEENIIDCEHGDSINGDSQFATDTLIAAVQGGHLHMCRHLLQLQEDSSVIAARRVAYAAAKARNKQLLQWLLSESGLTVSESGLFQYATVPQEDLATVLWLLEQGFTLPANRYTGTQSYFRSSLCMCLCDSAVAHSGERLLYMYVTRVFKALVCSNASDCSALHQLPCDTSAATARNALHALNPLFLFWL